MLEINRGHEDQSLRFDARIGDCDSASPRFREYTARRPAVRVRTVEARPQAHEPAVLPLTFAPRYPMRLWQPSSMLTLPPVAWKCRVIRLHGDVLAAQSPEALSSCGGDAL